MTFKTNLLPGTNNTWELGSSSQGWKITKINIPTTSAEISSSTVYSSGSSGQVLTSNGTNIYWGTPAAEVTESTVSGWGFTKNAGTITGATTNGGLKVTGTTLGHSNTAITAKTTAGVYPVKIDALGHITEAGTAIVSSAAASGGTTLSLVTTGEKYTWNNKSNLAIGTTATTAAAGNHTHTTSLATDSGTPSITLARSTTYKLTAGGTSVIFKTPADAHVMQSASGANTNYKLLFTTTASPTSGDRGPVFYNSNITINPYTSTITAINFNGTATKATQDSDGNTINTTYVKKSGDTMTGDLIIDDALQQINSPGRVSLKYVHTGFATSTAGNTCGISFNTTTASGSNSTYTPVAVSNAGYFLFSIPCLKNGVASSTRFVFYQKSIKSADATETNYYEVYSLPRTTNDLTANASYNILTTKLHFIDKTVATSAWSADSTYSEFSWKADIACTGVSSSHVPNVIFDYNELISGNFCPFADSSANTISIYCKEKPTATITIPTIYCT